jgi:hypothetical protein
VQDKARVAVNTARRPGPIRPDRPRPRDSRPDTLGTRGRCAVVVEPLVDRGTRRHRGMRPLGHTAARPACRACPGRHPMGRPSAPCHRGHQVPCPAAPAGEGHAWIGHKNALASWLKRLDSPARARTSIFGCKVASLTGGPCQPSWGGCRRGAPALGRRHAAGRRRREPRDDDLW